MSTVPPDFIPKPSPPDGGYKISSVHSQNDGLAPKDINKPADKAVITTRPPDDGKFLTWTLTRRGKTPNSEDLNIITLELGSGSNLFLSYDFAKKTVVLKNDRQPAWILTRDSAKQFQYKIAPLTSPKMFLTYKDKDKEVEICESTGNTNDEKKQQWIIVE